MKQGAKRLWLRIPDGLCAPLCPKNMLDSRASISASSGQNSAGFSLVDMLVALAIVGAIFAVMGGVFKQFSVLNRHRSELAVQAEMSALGRYLEAAISGAFPLPLVETTSRERIFLAGTGSAMRFTTVVRLGVHSSALRETVLRLRQNGEKQTLIQAFHQRRAGPSEDVTPSEMILMENVKLLRFRYLPPEQSGQEPVWLEEWTAEGTLPRAVRIELQIEKSQTLFTFTGLAHLSLAGRNPHLIRAEQPGGQLLRSASWPSPPVLPSLPRDRMMALLSEVSSY